MEIIHETKTENEFHHKSPINNANNNNNNSNSEDVMKLYVNDLSLDYKGNLPLRASTGSWKAAIIIIAIEFGERMSYFSIFANLIAYVTVVMHEDLSTAVNNVNIWGGVSLVMPIFGGFIGDAYLGRFYTTLFSGILYVMGSLLLIMTQYVPKLKPCGTSLTQSCLNASKLHKAVFFTAIYVMSMAAGGIRPCLEAFGADQFDNNHPEERKQKMSYFNWWNVSSLIGATIGVTVIVYIQENVGWGAAFLIVIGIISLIIVAFFCGRSLYRYKPVQGSPLTPLLMVLVAAFSKRRLPCPSDSSFLYEIPVSERRHGRVLGHTNQLRFLDKAAIIEGNNLTSLGMKNNSWRLTTVTQVEELKAIINLIPIWLTSLVFGVGLFQAQFYNKQASSMNRRLSSHFDIPAATLGVVMFASTFVSILLYDKLLVPYLRRTTGNERGISILNRIAVGMVLFALAMMVAAIVENKRLTALRNGHILSLVWLVPQTLIVGVADSFAVVGLQELFYDQVPDSMRSLGMAFSLTIFGVGAFINTALILTVNSVTSMNGGNKWIGKDVNHSRLDRFYWLLTVIFVLNFGVFVFLIRHYNYKKVIEPNNFGDCQSKKGEGGVELTSTRI